MIAGVFDPDAGERRSRLRDRLERGGEGGVRSTMVGPLALAWSEGKTATLTIDPPTGVGCLIEGRVTNLDEVAGRLRLERSDPRNGLLAQAYARLGEGFLELLRGDFVIVFWDRDGLRPLVVRDQLGGRALFLHRDGRRVTFASELKHLLTLLPRRPEPDRESVIDWLAGAYPRNRHTLHQAVEALPAAHVLSLNDGQARPRAFWSPRYQEPLDLPEEELPGLVRGALGKAVERACPSGERVGVLLSGGLDSATVAAIAAREVAPTNRPGAYSAVFPGSSSMDESHLIELVSEDLGLASRTMAVEAPSMLAGALDFLLEWELPLFAQNDAFWQPLMRLAAADGVDVMLDGEGGDLLFGAPRALIADRVRRLRLRKAEELAGLLLGGANAAPTAAVRRILRQDGLKAALPYGVHEPLRRALAGRHAPAWLLPRDVRRLVAREDPLAWKRMEGPLWWRQLADSLTAGLDALGAKSHFRRRAASVGLDARQPLLDLDLIELVLRLPPELAFDGQLNRPLMRKAVEGLVPSPILARRDKSRFDAVFLGALAGRDLAPVRRLLGPGAEVYRFADHGQVARELLEQPPFQHPRGHLYWLAGLWRLVTAECWLQFQGDRDWAPRLLDDLGSEGRRPRGAPAVPASVVPF